ncbi:MAG: ABC transporter substrate-binding protein [Candidatus Hodarchaeota archaeon]
MNKKKIIPIFLLVLILFSNIPFKYGNNIDEKSQITKKINNGQIIPPPPPFIYGTGNSLNSIDPHESWDPVSFEITWQVCETLFAYNLSDQSLPIIPQLASDFGTWDGPNPDGTRNYTVPLRIGVLFHDGTPFNSTAVKFSFDRLNYFVDNDLAQFATLYRYYDMEDKVEKLVLNRTEILGEYSVRFILNDAYVPFEVLLTSPGSSILSPTSTPPSSIIDLYTGYIVGTGPFVYDGYIPDEEVNFYAYNDYWKGKAEIEFMTFDIINSAIDRNEALLNGSIDFIADPAESYWSAFETDPNIVLLDSGITSTVSSYIGMSNYWINSTFRKAISYAINYTYFLEELTNGRVERLRSPIPEGMLYANSSFDVAYCNITKARMIMQSMGFGVGLVPTYPGPDEASWTASTFASFNYTYFFTNSLSVDMFALLTYYLDLIGIEVSDAGMNFIDFIYIMMEWYGHTRTELQLFWFSWFPDYNDPSNYINNFFTNRTLAYNGAMYDGFFSAKKAGRDPYDVNDNVQLLMDSALFEVDSTARERMYDRIQELLIEEDMPYAYLFVPHVLHAHDSNLSGFPQNAMKIIYFYPCNWTAPPISPPITILIDDSLPEYNWSKTAADNDWCTGSGTWSDPYIIEDLEINAQGVNSGIEIRNSNVFFKIRNCTVYNGITNGLTLLNVNNSIITNNSFYNTINTGIYLANSNNHTIEDNKIWNITMGYGIMVMMSNHNRILHNHVSDTYGGIASGNNFDIFIFDNIVMNNQFGIITGLTYNNTIEQNDVISNLFLGIGIQETNDTIVKDNFISDNGDFGIYFFSMMYGCFNNTVILNQIYNHDMKGLLLDALSSQNRIFQNDFIGNLVNAEDNGTLNSWDNGIIGNAWDDYIGVDIDDNGIGDTPYLIDGLAGSMDNFPIYDDGPNNVLIITIIEPISLAIYGVGAPDFNITIAGINIDTKWYTLDLGVTNITFSGLTGTFEQTEWDKLQSGAHIIRFYANNSIGQIFFNEVTIIKTLPEYQYIFIPGVNLFVVFPIILIAIIGLVLRYKKKFN